MQHDSKAASIPLNPSSHNRRSFALKEPPMLVTTDRVSAIFSDARDVHTDALRVLAAGDIRDTAERA